MNNDKLPPLPPGATLTPLPPLPEGAVMGRLPTDIRGSVTEPLFGDPNLMGRVTPSPTGVSKALMQTGAGMALMPLQFVTSAAKPLLGGAQMISKMFEERPQLTLADLVADRKPTKELSSVDKLIQEVNTMQENINKLAGPLSYFTTRPAEFIGEIAAPAAAGKGLYSLTQKMLPGTPRAASALTGTVGGGATAALQPVTPGVSGEEFLKEKGQQAAIGSVLGGTLGTIFGKPTTTDIERLRAMGITDLTPGMLSRTMKGLESFGQRFLPFVSGPIVEAEKRALNSFNYGAAKTVLDPLKINIPSGIAPGYELNNFVKTTISNRYKDIADKIDLPYTTVERDAIKNQIDQLASQMSKKAAKIFQSEVNSTLKNSILGTSIPGKNFREMESNLGTKAMDYISSKDAVDRSTGRAIFEFQEFMRGQLRSANPNVATELNQIHTAFKNSLPYERATKYAEAVDGIITPGMLRRASKNLTGIDVPIRDFADSAINVMGKRVVQSEGSPTSRAVGTVVGGLPIAASQVPAASSFMIPGAEYIAPAAVGAFRGLYSRPGISATNIFSTLPGGAIGTAAGAPAGALSTFQEDMRRRKEAMGLPVD